MREESKDMARERSETIIIDREISRLADLFPGYDYFKIADFFDTDRVTAMNINYNARGHAHSLYADVLTRWRNRYQDGKCHVRQKLLSILNQISSENHWLSARQYNFLDLDNNSGDELPVQETQSSRQSVQSSYQSTTAVSVTSVQSGITNYAHPGPAYCPQGFVPPQGVVPVQSVVPLQDVIPPPVMGYYDPSVYQIQRSGKQAVQVHKVLLRVAQKIVDWHEVDTLGIWLECDPNDVRRLRSENNSVKGASYHILSAFWERVTSPEPEKWGMVKSALEELEKETAILEIGLDVLSGERRQANQFALSGQSNEQNRIGSNGASANPDNLSQSVETTRAITCEALQGSQSNVSEPESTRRPFSFADPLPPEEPTAGPNDEQQLVLGNEKYVVSPGLKLRMAAYTEPKSLDELKEKVDRMVDSKQIHPRGVPVPRGPLALAIAEDNFLDYNWLGLRQFKDQTAKDVRSTKPVVVAVLDTGIYRSHPDLKDIVVQSENFVTNFPEPYLLHSQYDLDLDHGNHGTMVAGIIAEYGPVNTLILNHKVLPTLFQTSGGDITNVPSQEGSLEDIVSALNYISSLDGTNREVDIINMSFGNESTTQELNEKLSELAKNKVLIAAAGNEGARKANTIQWPGKHDSVICVGACSRYGYPMELSAVGREIDFLCPGEKIKSAAGKLMDRVGEDTVVDPGYFVSNGTSLAAPFATAVAANVIAVSGNVRQQVTCTQVMRSILSKLCTRYPHFETNIGYGTLTGEKLHRIEELCKEALEGR